MNKITLPFLKKDVGLGDVVQQLVDPQHRYINCTRCRARQQMLNSLLTFTGTQQQPPTRQNVPIERPTDWRQMYGAVDDESMPDGG